MESRLKEAQEFALAHFELFFKQHPEGREAIEALVKTAVECGYKFGNQAPKDPQLRLEDILKENEKYKEMYNHSPSFNKAIKYVANGGKELDMIYALCDNIKTQDELLTTIIMNNPSLNFK